MNEEIGTFLLSEFKQIKKEMKEILGRLESINRDLHGFKHQRFKCISECDKRYVRESDISNLFRVEIEKYSDDRDKRTHRKTEIMKNILQILSWMSPVLLMLFTYLAVKN